MSRIAVLGSGAWGTALALSLAAQRRHTITLWSHHPETSRVLQQDRENRHYLPGIPFPDNLFLTASESDAADAADWILCAIPSEFLRAAFTRFAPLLGSNHILISATKGIESGTGLRMSSVIHDCLLSQQKDIPVGALSGPSFALEVAQAQPTAITVAFSQIDIAMRAQQELSSDSLRAYTSDDLVGVELGGALKNVIAIATGIATGLGLGHNSTAALITRGIAEITRLAVAAGGRRETLAGLSGTGDLILTCTGALSRNRSVGIELGKGRKLPDILAAMNGKVAEGVRTTKAAIDLAQKLQIDMPITQQMSAILAENKDPRLAMRELMQRPARHEQDVC